MHLLITNDDGIDARGLALLEEVCAAHGAVTVIAPDQEQSGVGHRVHTRGALTLSDRGPERFALSGTPADCARVGLRGLGMTPDWVLSGLNHGGNLGVDIHMSGTVAGAREGAILGARGLAISQVLNVNVPLDPALVRRVTERVIATLLALPVPAGRFYNVNLPFAPESEEPEIVFCRPDPSPHDVRYERGADGFTYAGTFLKRERLAGHDFDVILAGKVAVSELGIV